VTGLGIDLPAEMLAESDAVCRGFDRLLPDVLAFIERARIVIATVETARLRANIVGDDAREWLFEQTGLDRLDSRLSQLNAAVAIHDVDWLGPDYNEALNELARRSQG
jgi:hypothetical protein